MEQAFESPIERMLYQALEPQILPRLHIYTQMPVLNYRADMLVATSAGVIVIECDGREFHDFWRDRRRDEDMINSGCVWQVIRFKGSDICFGADACIAEMRKVLPEMFYEDIDELRQATRAAAIRSWNHMRLQPILRGQYGSQEKSDYWTNRGKLDRVWSMGTILEMMASEIA